ncbi:MAG: alpha/beta hydrolase [Pseudomonadaceae bacterium]|nr:alpha/beta hydrolase [Pseudomonadaceae bacterium]
MLLRTLLALLCLITLPTALAGPLREQLQEWRNSRQQPLPAPEQQHTVLRDLAYGQAPLQRLDVYLPEHPKHAPVLLMVHGGAWQVGDKQAEAVVVNKVARWLPKGFILVSVNYRLLPDAAPLQQAEDVALALAFTQQQAASWGGDGNKIILIGHSAGAHLVSLLAAKPALASQQGAQPWLGTVALDSAALDVEQIMQQPHRRFYTHAFGAQPTYWAATSPFSQLDKSATALLMVCSSQRDDSCPQAQRFVAKAKSLGVQAQLHREDRSHKAINQDLGLATPYTQTVEAFMAGLDAEVAQRLGTRAD